MPYLFQKRGIRVIYKGSIFVQKSIAVNPQRICKCHRYIVLNGVSVILIQNQCRGHNANLFCQFPCGETLECPVILQILARCGAFFIGFVVKGQMNHDFAFRIEVNPCVIEITIGKERVYRHGGAYYVVSPFAMTWDDENYYMVAFDSAAGIIKHYRVDKMEKITVLDEERDGQDAYEALDMAVYARKTFGMFTGEEVKVHLRFENHLVGAVLDRLGQDVILVPDGEDHFTVWTDVIVSPQFFAWLCGFQTAAKVIGPDDVVKQMAEHVKSIAEQYE